MKPPSDYDAEDSWNGDGSECCAACGYVYFYSDRELYAADGTNHEHITDTEPDDKPIFCPDCWPEIDAERRKQENQSLTDYA